MKSAPTRALIEAVARRVVCVLRTAAIGAGLGAAGGALFGSLWGLLFGLLHGMWWDSFASAVGLAFLCGGYFGAGGAVAGMLTGGFCQVFGGGLIADTARVERATPGRPADTDGHDLRYVRPKSVPVPGPGGILQPMDQDGSAPRPDEPVGPNSRSTKSLYR
jgi:hypothetical protein